MYLCNVLKKPSKISAILYKNVDSVVYDVGTYVIFVCPSLVGFKISGLIKCNKKFDKNNRKPAAGARAVITSVE